MATKFRQVTIWVGQDEDDTPLPTSELVDELMVGAQAFAEDNRRPWTVWSGCPTTEPEQLTRMSDARERVWAKEAAW